MPRRSPKQPVRSRPVVRKARVAKRRPRVRQGMPAPRAFGAGLGRGAMAPAAVSSSWSLGRAQFVAPAKGGCMRIRHSEYLSNLSGATTFTALSVPLNPGLSSTFAWLSSLANNFESYHFHSLRAVYRTMKGTSTAGEVTLAIDFDAADGVPATKAEMFSYEGVVKAAPWENVAYVASPRNLSKAVELYTRSSLVAGTDIKTYDVGNLILAVDACADTSVVGDVFLEYDVEFFTPQAGSSSGPVSEYIVGATAMSKDAIFGTNPTINGTMIAAPSGSSLTFRSAGEYLLIVTCVGTVFVTPTISASTATITLVTASAVAAANTTYVAVWRVRVVAAGQTAVTDFSASTTVTQGYARIAPYAYVTG
jgi:hypothetical protein